LRRRAEAGVRPLQGAVICAIDLNAAVGHPFRRTIRMLRLTETDTFEVEPQREALPAAPRYEYRCVAAPAVVTVRRARERLKSVHALEETLNREATNGWEYVGIDELAILESPSFWSRKKQRTAFKVVVFRRPLA
jgi:hypothetical protein